MGTWSPFWQNRIAQDCDVMYFHIFFCKRTSVSGAIFSNSWDNSTLQYLRSVLQFYVELQRQLCRLSVVIQFSLYRLLTIICSEDHRKDSCESKNQQKQRKWQEILGRNNRLLSFDTTWTAVATRATVLLLHVFLVAGTCLRSRCPVTLRGYMCRQTDGSYSWSTSLIWNQMSWYHTNSHKDRFKNSEVNRREPQTFRHVISL
jgi:hypothetical protein